ncbi:MAG: hypothetical protein V1917_03310 [Candidatus Gottesmanbacteria bacterium]
MDETSARATPTTKEEVYITWTSPSRLFKRRNKEYFTNIGAIVFLLVVILIFAREFVLVAAVLSIVFLIYVLSTVPPEDITHRLTNLGIESAGHYYRWEECAAFWFEEQWGQVLFILQPIIGPRIIILLGAQDKKQIQDVAEKHIPFREQPEKSWVENTASWLAKKIPLEKPQ